MTRPPACLVRNARAATVRVRSAAAATKPGTGEPSVATARMACCGTRPDVERGGGSSKVGEFGSSKFEKAGSVCYGGVGESGKGVEHCGESAEVR